MKKKKILLLLPLLAPLLMSNSAAPNQQPYIFLEQTFTAEEYDVIEDSKQVKFEIENNSNFFLRDFYVSDIENPDDTTAFYSLGSYSFYHYIIPPYSTGCIYASYEELELIGNETITLEYAAYDYSKTNSSISYLSYRFLSYDSETNLSQINIRGNLDFNDDYYIYTVLYYIYDEKTSGYVYDEDYSNIYDGGSFETTIELYGNYEGYNDQLMNYAITMENPSSNGLGMFFLIIGVTVFLGAALIIFIILFILLIYKNSSDKRKKKKLETKDEAN